MVAWLLLIVGGVIEAFWPIALKATDGFTKPVPSIVSIVIISVAIVCFTIAVKTIPAATGYIVFIGMGAIGVVATAYFFYGEPVTLMKSFFILLILSGIIGLKVTS